MDQRQTQIREGAGLEESKLNVEFIDWLRKWSTPLLLVAAVAALGFVVYQRVEKSRKAEVDRAFLEFEAAAGSNNPSPESLKGIAETYKGIRSVGVMAKIRAADVHLRAVRTGLAPGARPQQDGSVAPEDLLNDDGRKRNLDEAERLYAEVLAATEMNKSKAVHAIGAGFGLAAVAESKGDMAAAKAAYERVVKAAEFATMPGQAALAKKKIEELPTLAAMPRLYAKAELPAPPKPPELPSAAPSPLTNPTATILPPAGEAAKPPEPAPEAPKPDAPKPSEPAPGQPASTESPKTEPAPPAANPK
ncbi:MAG: hypothetical protein ACKVW3_16945 [Phycisphaerales bacterium]